MHTTVMRQEAARRKLVGHAIQYLVPHCGPHSLGGSAEVKRAGGWLTADSTDT